MDSAPTTPPPMPPPPTAPIPQAGTMPPPPAPGGYPAPPLAAPPPPGRESRPFGAAPPQAPASYATDLLVPPGNTAVADPFAPDEQRRPAAPLAAMPTPAAARSALATPPPAVPAGHPHPPATTPSPRATAPMPTMPPAINPAPAPPPFGATSPVQGQIPPQFGDPALLDRPLKHKRSAGGKVVRATIALGVIAAVAVFGYAVFRAIQGDQLPESTADPSYRSSTFRETISGAGPDTDYVSVVTADTADRMIRVSFDRDDIIGWTGSDTHWVPIESPNELFENTPEDNETHADLLDIASGLTIDDVIPPGARDYTNVIDVEDATMLGQEVQRFETQIDVNRLQSRDPVAMAQFEDFWGAGASEPGAPASAPLNITVWVDSDGIVYQVESKSDYSASLYRLTFVEVSDTEPFTPVFPDEGR